MAKKYWAEVMRRTQRLMERHMAARHSVTSYINLNSLSLPPPRQTENKEKQFNSLLASTPPLTKN